VCSGDLEEGCTGRSSLDIGTLVGFSEEINKTKNNR
jgi:hypothetical protein